MFIEILDQKLIEHINATCQGSASTKPAAQDAEFFLRNGGWVVAGWVFWKVSKLEKLEGWFGGLGSGGYFKDLKIEKCRDSPAPKAFDVWHLEYFLPFCHLLLKMCLSTKETSRTWQQNWLCWSFVVPWHEAHNLWRKGFDSADRGLADISNHPDAVIPGAWSQGVAAFLLRDLLEFASFCSLLPMFLPFVLMFLVLFFFLQAIQKESVVNCWLEFWASPLFHHQPVPPWADRVDPPLPLPQQEVRIRTKVRTVDGKVMVTRQLLASFQHFLRHHRIFTISTLQDFVHQQYHSRQDGRTCCFFLPCVFTGWSHHIPFITTRLPGQTTPDENCRSPRRQRRDQKEWIDRRGPPGASATVDFALPGVDFWNSMF